MICAAVSGSTIGEMRAQIKAVEVHACLIEVRLDALTAIIPDEMPQLRACTDKPMVFTLRSQSQGGGYKGTEGQRLAMISMLASFKPAYFDIEWDVPASFLDALKTENPEVKLIISYHNFHETPDNLDAVLQRMSTPHAYWYKIAVMGNTSLDMLRLMHWVQNKSNVIAVSMGTAGSPSRLIGPVVGCPVTFGCVDEAHATAPGQLPVSILDERYRAETLKRGSALYGLIGDPVDKSISDQTHNHLMGELGIDAVYVKIQIKPEELEVFFAYARQLPFCGLSVTMPLKEHVIKYLDEIDPIAKSIGAVNTLVFTDGKICGYNTDAMGALNSLEAVEEVASKRVVILGAGGAAKAIAYEACRRGASVSILNRDGDKARFVADQLGCVGRALDQMPVVALEGYDMLINTTPVEMPIDKELILKDSIVMDIKTWPQKTALLEQAIVKGATPVYGYRMFVEQAIGQYSLWFGERAFPARCREVLQEKAIKVLSAR